ncbi:MAG: cation:proton antiporter [Sphaerochaetaceae bacterium]|nr:cation:proton antiporter [Sphaerochaetaceae bacterium]
MTQLLAVAIALMGGMLMTRVFKKLGFNFPDVTAFLIAGIVIGPYCLGQLGIEGLGFTSIEEVKETEVISSVALGFIAFAIGNEFRLSHLKGIGKQATVVGIFQAIVAMIVVDIVLITIHFIFGDSVISIPAAITLGAIATATAPAATLMVVRQYKAKGKLTSLLLPVVALDDAVGLVAFAISYGIAQSLGTGSASLISIIVNPMVEIIASLILGSILGIVLTKLEELFYSNTNRLNLSISFVLITIALSSLTFEIGPIEISFSSLLVCMMLGTVLCNLCPRSGDIMLRTDKWDAPLLALFFVLSGAELELSVFTNISVVIVGIIYIIARSIGKYYGAYGSCKLTKCSESTTKYLGFTLLPQAGVALGMSQTAAVALGGGDGRFVRNIVLFGVLVYELAGPSITRWALTKSGDIQETPHEKKSHDRFTTPKEHRGHILPK